jgi:iron-sulfur cluster insertion protein
LLRRKFFRLNLPALAKDAVPLPQTFNFTWPKRPIRPGRSDLPKRCQVPLKDALNGNFKYPIDFEGALGINERYTKELCMSLETSTQTPTPINPDGISKPISLTENAIQKVKEFIAKDPNNHGKNFRIYVEGGGCSGYQYGFTFDAKRADDIIVNCGDIEVLVDPQSRIYLQNSTIDYENTLKSSGFIVQNPNSKGSCGCGVSFTV